MSQNAATASVTSSAVQPASAGSGAGGDFTGSKSAQDVEDIARYRLVIEEGPQAGSFIYKTMDRVTGEIIRQFPREQVIQMMESRTYGAGSVVDIFA